jgi:hypothetical protein
MSGGRSQRSLLEGVRSMEGLDADIAPHRLRKGWRKGKRKDCPVAESEQTTNDAVEGVTTLKPLNGKRQAPVTAHAEKLRLLRAVAQAGMRKRQVRRIQECRGNTEQLKGTDARHRGLTFDMSGGRKQAQHAAGRPLDGVVRRRRDVRAHAGYLDSRQFASGDAAVWSEGRPPQRHLPCLLKNSTRGASLARSSSGTDSSRRPRASPRATISGSLSA